jgi:hypothetical protein
MDAASSQHSSKMAQISYPQPIVAGPFKFSKPFSYRRKALNFIWLRVLMPFHVGITHSGEIGHRFRLGFKNWPTSSGINGRHGPDYAVIMENIYPSTIHALLPVENNRFFRGTRKSIHLI